MDYSYIFRSALPDYGTFAAFGFEKKDEGYICRKALGDTGFYALIRVHDERITAEVYEKSADGTSPDSKYALFDVKSANGAFVSCIRAQVQEIMNDFTDQPPGYRVCIRGLLLALMIRLLRVFTEESAENDRDKNLTVLTPALDYLYDHYAHVIL